MEDTSMKKLGLMAAALLLGATMTVGSGFVPATVDQAIAATKQEKAAKRAATRAKRADCRAQAKAQKLGFIRAQRFVRSCMKKA
jgi:hypothetical protein